MAKKASTRTTRNPPLLRGLRVKGRVAQDKAQAKWKFSKKGLGKDQPRKRVAATRQDKFEGKFYAADDTTVPLRSHRGKSKPAKLRKTISAGSVVILLAGRHRGKRVVVLKQLPSGLLLVSGPFKVNGVPLRRVNQAYVIATSTKVDVSKVDVSKVDDKFFAAPKHNASQEAKDFFTPAKSARSSSLRRTSAAFTAAPHVSQAKKDETKRVGAALLAAIKATPNLKEYLGAKFSLTRNQKPHQMKF